MSLEVLLLLIFLALAFDFMNGFHDAANSIATVVSTGVLRPQNAVLFAAFFNFIALFLTFLVGSKVAATIGKGSIDASIVDQYVIFGALIGAIFWNLLTWYYGIPSSSSHALIGGLIGATVAKVGTDGLIAAGITKTVVFIVVSPLLGMLFGSLLMLAVSWLCFRMTPHKVDRWFRRLQLVSSALYSVGHGSNDAQKTAGIIWMLLIFATQTNPDAIPHWLQSDEDHFPFWALATCFVVIGLGTMFGGWRIVKTMGQKLTKLKPVGGFCAETGGAITLGIASSFGIPVSTTHTITGAIVGVGTMSGPRAVRWGIAGGIVWAWILTIPCSAFVAAVFWWLGQYII